MIQQNQNHGPATFLDFPVADPDSLPSLDILDEDHHRILERAVKNVLDTELAESVYAQILDGLPTEESVEESYEWIEDHPVHTIPHAEICPGYVDKAREFRAKFDSSQLRFQRTSLLGFQDNHPDTDEFKLRLVELVVVACHQIGAHLYELNDGTHPHELYQKWLDQVNDEKEAGVVDRKFDYPTRIAFAHPVYQDAENYPRGFADIAGYWAESKIFGGVVLFDRGEREQECKAIWMHSDLSRGPRTLYPPTTEQYDSLINFLLAEPSQTPNCPLPIIASMANRPRWNAYHAFAYQHIFRDRYERRVPSRPPGERCVRSANDWPELHDQNIITFGLSKNLDRNGERMVSDEQVAVAEKSLWNITSSSPLWPAYQSLQEHRAVDDGHDVIKD